MVQLTRVGMVPGIGGAGGGGGAPIWVERDANGVPFDWDFDFENGRYWGDPATYISTNLANLTGLVALTSSAGDVTGTAAMTTFMTGTYTIKVKLPATVPVAGANSGVISHSGSTASPIFLNSNGTARNYRSADSPNFTDSNQRVIQGYAGRTIVISQGALGRLISQNGTAATVDADSQATPAAIHFGRYNGGSYLNAAILRISGAKRQVSAADHKTLSGPMLTSATFAGQGYMRGVYNEFLSLPANTFAFERTQALTVTAMVQLNGIADATGTYLASLCWGNVSNNGANFPGQEGFVFSDGKPRLRVISNFGTLNYLERGGSTVLHDGVARLVTWKLAGDSVAANYKIWVNGVAETMTTVRDTLSASIVSAPQYFTIGNQVNRPGYHQKGFLGGLRGFQIRTVAVPDATIEGWGSTPPEADADTISIPDWVNISGTTLPDLGTGGVAWAATSPDLLVGAA